jgi:outer membrane protein OmpA-like peptidoglycan-associated protein
MPATNGQLGLFTVESAYTLPQGGFSASSYVNKVARMPGDITVLSVGTNFSVGVTDWFQAHFQFEPYRFIHVSRPERLSLRSPIGNPGFPPPPAQPTIFRSLLPTPGIAPGYVEDFPFANRNSGDIGEVVVGFKFGMFSEWRGDPITVSFSNDFVIPTKRSLGDLLDAQAQSGQFNYIMTLSASRTWWKDRIVSNWNLGYRITRDPRSNNVRLFTQADQLKLATGTILFPKSRIQLMFETVATIFVGPSTQNTSFGPRDPIDSVYGIRLYPWSNVGLDIGYRRTNNLRGHGEPSGFIFKLGTVHWPEKPKPVNRYPVAQCSADKAAVVAETGDTVNIRAAASDPDGDTLSYSWSATGGSVSGTGANVVWNSSGTRTGVYTITATVTDGQGGSASCSVDVKVDPRPNRAPTLRCSADRSSVLTGERVRITATGSDPDGETLSYSWRTNGGQIVGSGPSVQLDTTGLARGRYTVTGRAEDPHGAAADCNVSVNVDVPPPPAQASKINECFFRSGSATVDNVCKRILDDVAVRLQNEPRARVVLIGFSDPREPRTARLGQDRANASKKYLESKGIASSRVDTRTAGGQAGAGRQNRRVDVIFVPEGATY